MQLITLYTTHISNEQALYNIAQKENHKLVSILHIPKANLKYYELLL
jgi:hypothetical protein